MLYVVDESSHCISSLPQERIHTLYDLTVFWRIPSVEREEAETSFTPIVLIRPN